MELAHDPTAEPAPARTEPQGVGAFLRERRIALGLTYADVANVVKLPPRRIESLEGERWDELPDGPFLRGFLRNLALIYYERKDFSRARFYVAQVNGSPAPSAASLWLGIRIERKLGNKNNEIALENQLERMFANSREAQMQRRGNYND